MASVVDICNLALSNIRANSINSLNESSLEAQQCSLHYPVARDYLLSNYRWSFANSVEPLVQLTDVTIPGWKYAYKYPNNCLHIERLFQHSPNNTQNISTALDRIEYDVITSGGVKLITSNVSDLWINYRSKVLDSEMYSVGFVNTLSWLLASELATPIVGGPEGRSYRAESFKIYQQYLASSIANDRNEHFKEMPDSEFITVRQ